MLLSPKLQKDLDDAALMVASVYWDNWTREGEGACIPIAFSISEFLNLRNRPARVAETTMEARDPLNMRLLQIDPAETWLGHAVVVMPTHGLLLDGSLWTQKSKVLANFTLPKLLVVPWHKTLGAKGRIDRLTIRYEPDLQANGWRKRDWPWDEFRKMVRQIDQDIKELDA